MIGSSIGLDRLALHLNPGHLVTQQQALDIEGKLERRLDNEPMAYILGISHFHELSFRVTPDVLIPRPETELLVEKAIAWIRVLNPTNTSGLRFADIGTGSGNIFISILHQCPESTCLATEISPAALDIARLNADDHHVAGRVEFRTGDMTQAFNPGEKFDAILSNPPYIGRREIPHLSADVVNWEPHDALFSENNGMQHIENLIEYSSAHLVPEGLLLIEIGHEQRDRTLSAVSRSGAYSDTRVLNDLSGKPRLLEARRNILSQSRHAVNIPDN